MKLPAPDDLHLRLGAALVRLQLLTASSERKVADDAGLSRQQLLILGIVGRATVDGTPGPRVGALAQQMKVTAGTVSVALNALEEKGLVKRCQDPTEHRATVVELTGMGRRKANHLDGDAEEALRPIVEELGADSGGRALAAVLDVIDAAERQGRIDGVQMCSRCRFFGLHLAHGNDPSAPHRCELLKRDIGPADLQIDCPDFEAADADDLPERPSLLIDP